MRISDWSSDVCSSDLGSWSGDLVVIVFASMEQAQAWYHSEAYGAIRKLRTANTEGDVLLVQGVADGHKGADILGGGLGNSTEANRVGEESGRTRRSRWTRGN